MGSAIYKKKRKISQECVETAEKCEVLLDLVHLAKSNQFQGPDHVQVFWKHKSIGNQAYDWLTQRVNQSEAWFPIDLCFQNNHASKTLAHDPAPIVPKARLVQDEFFFSSLSIQEKKFYLPKCLRKVRALIVFPYISYISETSESHQFVIPTQENTVSLSVLYMKDMTDVRTTGAVLF